MLTTDSYLIALGIYLSAGGFTIFFVYRWLGGFLSRRPQRVLTAVAAALLLTPAPATLGADTCAPALIVGVFDLLFNGGWAAAQSALLNLAAALLLSLIVGILLSRGRSA